MDSVVSLLMQLEGDEAVEALNTIMECVPLCTAGLEEGMEDGEISSMGIAQTQLLEGVQGVMVREIVDATGWGVILSSLSCPS